MRLDTEYGNIRGDVRKLRLVMLLVVVFYFTLSWLLR